jgi:hypothetical protein
VPRGSLWRGVFRAKRDRSDETNGAGEKKRTLSIVFFHREAPLRRARSVDH